MTGLTNGPMFLSSTALFTSVKRLLSLPKIIAWSWRSHSPPWSQIGQSRGWLICGHTHTHTHTHTHARTRAYSGCGSLQQPSVAVCSARGVHRAKLGQNLRGLPSPGCVALFTLRTRCSLLFYMLCSFVLCCLHAVLFCAVLLATRISALTSRNSITPSLAFLTTGVLVLIFMPGAAGMAQDACGLGLFSICDTIHPSAQRQVSANRAPYCWLDIVAAGAQPRLRSLRPERIGRCRTDVRCVLA